MGDLGKDEEVGKNGDARQRGNIGKETKITNTLKKKKETSWPVERPTRSPAA